MADTRFHGALRHVRGLAGRPPGESDADLLGRYTAAQDWTAFAAIVRRHGPLVLRVCRRVLGHEQDAEDAFQATFLVLARKAGTLRDAGALVGWLHGAAHRMAKEMRRAAGRRKVHEAKAAQAAPSDPAWEAAWREVQAAVDQEVRRLPERLRAPFLLCCQEGHGQAEAAKLLGVPEGTVWSRLSQARENFSRRLARRGIALSAVLGTAALADEAQAGLPVGMTAAATRAAQVFTADGGKVTAGTTGVSAEVIQLAEWGVRAMAASKYKLGLMAILTAGALAAGGAVLVQGGPAPVPVPVAPGPDTARAADRPNDPLPPGARMRLGTVRMRHRGGVQAVAFTPDGRHLTTAGDDNTIRIWDPVEGRATREIAARATNLALSPDGTVIAGTLGRSVQLWDARTGRELRTIRRGPDFHTPAPLAFSADGTTLAVTDGDGAIILVATATGEEKLRLPPQKESPTRMAFLAGGKQLVSVHGQIGPTVCIWDLETGKLARENALTGDKARVRPLALSRDGATLALEHAATARQANPGGGWTVFTLYRLTLWDVATGTERVTTDGETDVLWAAAFTPDGSRVATAGMGNHASVYDAATGKLLHRLPGPPDMSRPDGLTTVAFAPDGGRLAVVGSSATVRVWDLNTAKEIGPQGESHEGHIAAVSYAPNGQTLATGGGDHTVRIWDATTGGQKLVLRGHGAAVKAIAWSADGHTLASADMHSAIRLWDAATGQLRHTIQAVPRSAGVYHGICPLAFTPDGSGLYSWGDDRRFRLWDVATGKELASRPAELTDVPPAPAGRPQNFNPEVEGVTDVAFAPGGTLAAVAVNGSVRLVDPATGKEQRKLPGQVGSNKVAFSSDGRMVAVGGWNRLVVVWDVATGTEVMRVKDIEPVDALAFTPDGRAIAAAAGQGDGVIHLLDVRTGAKLSRLVGHRSFVNALAFRPDGRSLATAQRDTTALIWDVPK